MCFQVCFTKIYKKFALEKFNILVISCPLLDTVFPVGVLLSILHEVSERWKDFFILKGLLHVK